MTSYPYQHSNNERDHGDHAPEAVDMLSPMTPLTNLESELQSKYQSSHHAEHAHSPVASTDKEVVTLEHENALKHVVPMELNSAYPETTTTTSPRTPSTATAQHAKSLSDDAPEALPAPNGGGGQKKKKILGMNRTVFLVLVVVIVVIIAAGVGGGVGGAVASSKKSDATPATTSGISSSSSALPPSSSSNPTPSSTKSTSTASPSQTVSFLNNQTWPEGYDYAFQGWSRANFTGAATKIASGDGGKNVGTDFEFDLHSYIWIPNIGNCCVNFCTNSTSQSWLGYRCNKTNRTEASDPVARAFFWCDNNHTEATARAKGCS
ncbi:hypothetical protein QQS21_000284 [Conoideocrella luteorostrata]|uniref:Uncharacterized protein n=1 Tax=Conoideocrella luteorostrata TaxID=1105319 RepID=A0AAJ0CZE6_9HYPO|nr:hypothetical protein QQS21_000284 [Conoideocrella luteorostrata]